ncbi:ABC transporter substrate-binding protein [uncultured Brevundimonas sp.]|uniref:ABC transporter substrate-binding protein n=1 Tax=uncultured Brevundimonas sp. TaxID=213418 RepID=UPI0025ECC415|nr:ABC transporter substrate-binding protein [uncultured Brevundimonas sp.]
MKLFGAVVVAAGVLVSGTAEARPLRVMSLDQCGDQYAMALSPDATLALSPRADDPDSWMKAEASRYRRVRPTLEAAIAFQPDVVVRYWGGEPRLLAALERRGMKVLTIDDATTMKGVRANIIKVAEGLDQRPRGDTLVVSMGEQLDEARPAAGQTRSSALYLTPGGFTAGKGTLMDAILTAAGFDNLTTSPGYVPVSVERVALSPPKRFILGFFDLFRSDWRGPGRHPVVRGAAKGRVAARLPASALTCPAWFAADAAVMASEGR